MLPLFTLIRNKCEKMTNFSSKKKKYDIEMKIMPWKSCLICSVYIICDLNVLEGKVFSGSDELSYSQGGGQSFCDSKGNWKKRLE